MLRTVKTLLVALMIGILALASYAGITYKLDSLKTSFGDPVLNTKTSEARMREVECLARNIYHEAGYEDFEGKVAVAQVTMNRTDSGKFPNDVCKVVYQKNIVYEKVICQFSWYCEQPATVKPANKKVYEESYKVAQQVLLEGYRLPSLVKAMYYHADYVNPGWQKKRIAKIGRHIFYEG